MVSRWSGRRASSRRAAVAVLSAVVLGAQFGGMTAVAQAAPASAGKGPVSQVSQVPPPPSSRPSAEDPYVPPGREMGFVPGPGRQPPRKGKGFDPKTSEVVPDLTTETRQVWKNADGTMTAKVSTRPVRTQESDGSWVDIDLSLQRGGDGRLRPKHAPVAVSVAADSAGALATVELAKDRTVSLRSVGAAGGVAAKTRNEKASEAEFVGALPAGVTARVAARGDGVETSYVLPDAAAATRPLREQLDLPDGWSARQSRELKGVVELMDDAGHVVGLWGGGPVQEAAPAKSESAAAMKLESVKDGVATALVDLDKAWLARPDRRWPVVVDPSVTGSPLSGSNPGSFDTFVNEDSRYTAWSYPTWDVLMFGSKYGAGYRTRSLLKFDLSNIPSTAVVLKADLSFSVIETAYGTTPQPQYCSPVDVDAEMGFSGWAPQTTWANQPDANASTAITSSDTVCPGDRPSVDIAAHAQQWVRDPSSNYGERLSGHNETAADDYLRLASADTTTPGLSAPTLTVMWDRAPTESVQTAPANGAIVTSLRPTLVSTGSTDPDGDPVYYWFRATSNLYEAGTLIESQWIGTPSFQIPAGYLHDGATYYWVVYTASFNNGTGEWAAVRYPSQVFKFTVDLRLGDKPTAAYDKVGPAAVNLVNGNVVYKTSLPSMTTVGGDVGLSLTYNSQSPEIHGLTGAYYPDWDKNQTPDTSYPLMIRTDPAISMAWPSSPVGGTNYVNPQTGFMATWTGYVSPAATGTYLFGTRSDDGARITLNNTNLVYNSWTSHAAPASCEFSTSATVSMTIGQPTPIKVEYYDKGGAASIALCVRQPDGSVIDVPSSWLTPSDSTALPRGWSVSTDLDGSLQYASAETVSGSGTLPRQVVIVDTTGARHTYQWNSVGAGYSPPPGESGVLSVDPNQTTGANEITLVADDGYTYKFDMSGHLTGATRPADDIHPAAAQYVFTGTPSRLTAIKDPVSNRQITLSYSVGGYCGTATTLPSGLLCQVTYPDGRVTQFQYGQWGPGTDPFLIQVVNPGGETTQLGYDASGLLSTIRDPLAYDEIAAGLRQAADYNDTTLSYVVDGDLRRAHDVALPSPRSGDPRPAHHYTFTVMGNGAGHSTVDVAGLNPAIGYARRIDINEAGQVTRDTDATGKYVSTTWDNSDHKLSETDTANLLTAYTYDTVSPAQRLLSVTGPALVGYTGQKPVAYTNYDEGLQGLAASYWTSPDFSGSPTVHATGVGDPSGALNVNWGTGGPFGSGGNVDNWSARFTGEVAMSQAGWYDFRVARDDGARLFIDDHLILDSWAAGSSTTISYNNTNTATRHRIRVDFKELTGSASLSLYWTPPSSGETLVPGSALFPSYGLVTSTVDADGHRVNTEYSRTGEVGPEAGLPTATVVDPAGLGLRSETHYEAQGTKYLRRLYHTLPKGAATKVSDDYYGDQEIRTAPAECGGGSYNQAGLTKTSTDATSAGGSALVREYIHDHIGRTVAYRVATDTRWSCHTFDSRGRVTSDSDPAGHVTTYSYSTPGSVTTSYVDSAGATRTTMATVDLLGRTISYTDENGATTTTLYDQAGRAVRTDRAMPNPADSRTPFTTTTYDDAGRPLTLTEYASGSGRTTTYGYDAAGRPATVTRPNGVVTTQNYDGNMGWIYSLSNTKNGVELSPWTYGHKLSGKINSETTTGRIRNFNYDNAGRLTQTVEGSTTRNYAYDANSNRCANAASCDNSFTYDNADRLTASPYASSYTYDNHGNMTSATRIGTPPPDTSTQRFAFDARNSIPSAQSSTVTSPGAGTLSATLAWNATGAPAVYQTGTPTGWSLAPGQTMTAATINAENQTDVAATVTWPQNSIASATASGTVTTGSTSSVNVPVTATGLVSASVDWQPSSVARTATGTAGLLSYVDTPITVSANGTITATETDTMLVHTASVSLVAADGSTVLATANEGQQLSYNVTGITYPATVGYILRVNGGLLGAAYTLRWNQPDTARVSLGLYNPAGQLVAQSANNTTKPNTVSYTTAAAGTYVVKVVASDTAVPVAYSAAYTLNDSYPTNTYADVTVNLVDPTGATVATSRAATGSASVHAVTTTGGNWKVNLVDNSTNLAVNSSTTSWSATTVAADSASGTLNGGATATRQIAVDGQGYVNAKATWTAQSGSYADVTLNLLNPSGTVIATSRAATGTTTTRFVVPGAGTYTLQLVNNSASIAAPWTLATTYPAAHTPRFALSVKNSAGTTIATTTASTSPTTLTASVAAGSYTIVAAPQTGAGNATVTTNYPGHALSEVIGYDAHDHATTINDGTNTVTEVLAPSGRVLRRTVRDNTSNAVVEDTINGYADDGDSPAWTAPAAGGPVTSYIAGTLVIDTAGTPVYPIANGHGDIVGTTDTTGAYTAAPVTDEYGIGQPATNRLGWLGAKQRAVADTRLDLIRMGVRLYDPALGRLLEVDPVEGGSANDYDYAEGDCVNKLDLNGTSTDDPWGERERYMAEHPTCKKIHGLAKAMSSAGYFRAAYWGIWKHNQRKGYSNLLAAWGWSGTGSIFKRLSWAGAKAFGTGFAIVGGIATFIDGMCSLDTWARRQ